MIVSKFFTYLKARALLHPLPRLHRSIPVQVGAKVAVSAYTGVAELLQQLVHQQPECRALLRRAGVLRISQGIQSAFVADAYRMLVVTAAMRTGQFQRTGSEHGAVAADIVMVARRAETAAAVLCLQSFGSERAALPRGAAMHHDVVDFSHK